MAIIIPIYAVRYWLACHMVQERQNTLLWLYAPVALPGMVAIILSALLMESELQNQKNGDGDGNGDKSQKINCSFKILNVS
mgnify:CR=1 FL=1